MNAQDLAVLFDDWRDTTRAEREAITNGRWTEVAEHQEHKRALQRAIVRTTDEWQQRWPRTGETSADYERRFRPVLSELISLETQNASLIDELRAVAQGELNRTEQSASTLRSVRRAYGSEARAHWASYS